MHMCSEKPIYLPKNR
ncbi:hypothetical protein X798_04715 [Onchocerca flexuosa]|uniref:Uncharacterized protein n=1 Tax=Onchocerca flexuosa TaxID=387005 RepID=A0A238BTL0_9BILA|nr:hypothetical protein X798_04715 [Onchocerca flexuosa]